MARKATRLSDVRRARATRERADWVPSGDVVRQEIRRLRTARYRRHRQNVAFYIAVISFALGYLLFSLGFELVTVRGTGMDPTLKSGNMVLCVRQSALDKLVGLIPEDVRRLQRDELMLLRYRVEPDGVVHKKERSVMLIKRAAGLPGDVIDAAGGELIVNRETDVGELVSSDLVYPVTVPTGCVFALGDNRSLSVDSRQRAFGMVPEADVIGRPVAVVWPVYAMGLVK